jgi:RNA recognition motif-containing protein
MSKRLYIGNLSYNTSEDTLRNTFGASQVIIPSDHQGRPKGFAFVEVDEEKAADLITEWNGKDLDGRTIVVNEARPREDRPQQSGGYRRAA